MEQTLHLETSNIKDGSNIMAIWRLLSLQVTLQENSLVALHNDGGVGIGKSINGGFGMLDGSKEVDEILKTVMCWDVMGGVSRRAWARNQNSIDTCIEYNEKYKDSDHITIPFVVDDSLVEKFLDKVGK